jgi:S1-C subfamily serine protease
LVGVRNGDVIQVVNGQKLTSVQKAYQVYRKARVQSSFTIHLLRGGRDQKKLSFKLKDSLASL